MASGKKNYFRHSFFARNDEVVMDLIDEFGFQGYFLWFSLLELCGEQAADEYPEKFIFHKSRLLRELRCKQVKLETFLGLVQVKSRLTYTLNGNYYEIQVANLRKYLGKYQTKNTPKLPNKRKGKESKEKESKVIEKQDFSFLKIKVDSEILSTLNKMNSDNVKSFCKDYGEENFHEYLERLHNYISSTGKRYKNYVSAMRTWARKDGLEKINETPFLDLVRQYDSEY